jgi:hypothetical protein
MPDMVVHPHDKGTFLVSSQTGNGNWYLVDMRDESRPEGRCNCDDYMIRIDSALNKKELPERFTCKHIRRCVDFALDHLARSSSP